MTWLVTMYRPWESCYVSFALFHKRRWTAIRNKLLKSEEFKLNRNPVTIKQVTVPDIIQTYIANGLLYTTHS